MAAVSGIKRPAIPGKAYKKAKATETAKSNDERLRRKVQEVAELKLKMGQPERKNRKLKADAEHALLEALRKTTEKSRFLRLLKEF